MKYNERLRDAYYSILFNLITRKKHQTLQRDNKYFAVFLNDSISNTIQTSGLYEKELLVPLFNILSKSYRLENGIAIDAGANIGNHTLFFSNYFKKVVSFEPNPITFKLLEVNTYFKSDRITVNNFGLSDTNENLKLSVLEGNYGGSSGNIDHNSSINHMIKVKRLDDYLSRSTEPVKLIKIDVEGMETNVLRGSIQTIKSHTPIILFELWSLSFINGVNESEKLLNELGYEIYQLEENKNSRNIYVRRLKRLILIITNGHLEYNLVKKEQLKKDNYMMLVAIHKTFRLIDPK